MNKLILKLAEHTDWYPQSAEAANENYWTHRLQIADSEQTTERSFLQLIKLKLSSIGSTNVCPSRKLRELKKRKKREFIMFVSWIKTFNSVA